MSLLNNFNKECQKVHKEYAKFFESNNLIYHYTGYNALDDILKEQKIRFVDYRYLNDGNEIVFGKEIIFKKMLEFHKKYPTIYYKINDLYSSFDEYFNFYISSFSKTIDKLALWRYYASNCTGCAIGFDNCFYSPNEDKSDRYEVVTGEIIYGGNCHKIVDKYFQLFIEAFGKTNSADDETRSKLFSTLFSNLLSLLPFFKDESFEEENELRLLYFEDHKFQQNSIDVNDLEFFDIKQSEARFVNSVTGKKAIFTPKKFKKNNIKQIWIGPACNFLETEKHVLNLLKNHGYNTQKIDICKTDFNYNYF